MVHHTHNNSLKIIWSPRYPNPSILVLLQVCSIIPYREHTFPLFQFFPSVFLSPPYPLFLRLFCCTSFCLFSPLRPLIFQIRKLSIWWIYSTLHHSLFCEPIPCFPPLSSVWKPFPVFCPSVLSLYCTLAVYICVTEIVSFSFVPYFDIHLTSL